MLLAPDTSAPRNTAGCSSQIQNQRKNRVRTLKKTEGRQRANPHNDTQSHPRCSGDTLSAKAHFTFHYCPQKYKSKMIDSNSFRGASSSAVARCASFNPSCRIRALCPRARLHKWVFCTFFRNVHVSVRVVRSVFLSNVSTSDPAHTNVHTMCSLMVLIVVAAKHLRDSQVSRVDIDNVMFSYLVAVPLQSRHDTTRMSKSSFVPDQRRKRKRCLVKTEKTGSEGVHTTQD